jgi:hypothetical protein
MRNDAAQEHQFAAPPGRADDENETPAMGARKEAAVLTFRWSLFLSPV